MNPIVYYLFSWLNLYGGSVFRSSARTVSIIVIDLRFYGLLYTVSDRSSRIRLGVEALFGGRRVLTKRSWQISFDKLDYVLEVLEDDERDDQCSLRQYLKNYLLRPPAPPDFSVTPSPWDLKLGYLLVRGTVGKGSFATVSAAKHTATGEAGQRNSW